MLNRFFIEEHVRKALEEDIGFGDITTDYLTDENKILKLNLLSLKLKHKLEYLLPLKEFYL